MYLHTPTHRPVPTQTNSSRHQPSASVSCKPSGDASAIFPAHHSLPTILSFVAAECR